MSNDVLSALSDDQITQLLDAKWAMEAVPGVYVHLPELDRTTEQIVVPVVLVRPRDGEIDRVPRQIAGLPVRVTITRGFYYDDEVVWPSDRASDAPAAERSE